MGPDLVLTASDQHVTPAAWLRVKQCLLRQPGDGSGCNSAGQDDAGPWGGPFHVQVIDMSGPLRTQTTPTAEHQSWVRHMLIIAVAAAGALIAPEPAANAAPPPCPKGWEHNTFDEAVALPLFQQGLREGLFTIDDLREGFNGFDVNGNGSVCMKHTPNLTLPHPYMFRDDRIS